LRYFSDNNLVVDNLVCDIKGLNAIAKPLVGDVLKVFFSKKGSYFVFEGFCYSTLRKNFCVPDSGLKLINKIKGFIVSFIFSFFYNLIFSFEKINFKKSKYSFRSSKVTKFRTIII